MTRSVYFETYGCQMNEVDSGTMRDALLIAGHRTVEKMDEADTIVVTTCAVRESAEEKVWGRLGEFKRWKSYEPGRLVVVAGCMAERNGAAMLRRARHVDVLVGTAHFDQVATLIDERVRGDSPVVSLGVPRGKIPAGFALALAPPSAPAAEAPFASWTDRAPTGLHAYVKIMEGCDHFCTYCIVPMTRGKERSRSPGEIVREVESRVARGVREVTLLGQNVNSYGKGLHPSIRFSDLLALLDAIPGLLRIRFTTSHPVDCRDDLLQAMRDLPKVCEHLHLPFQSGSDRILSLMNRTYSSVKYLELLDRARGTVPGIAVTTDVIVAFPTETEEEYESTVRMMDRAQFDAAFLFRFSPRPGTPAAAMDGAVDDETASRRLSALIRMQSRITERASKACVGTEVSVLVEGASARNPGQMMGRTPAFKVAVFDGPPSWTGTEVPMRITDASTWTLRAEPLAVRR